MLAQILWAIVLVPLLLVGGFLVLLYLKARQRSRFPPPAVRTRTRSSTSTSSNAPTPFAYVGWQLVCDRHFRLRHWHRPRDRQVPREARLPCRGDGAESRGTRRGSPSLSVPPSHAESLRTRGVRSWARVSRTRRLERSRTIKSISRTTSRFKRYATTRRSRCQQPRTHTRALGARQFGRQLRELLQASPAKRLVGLVNNAGIAVMGPLEVQVWRPCVRL